MFADLENRQLMGLVGTTFFTSRKVFVSYTRRSDMITPRPLAAKATKKNCTYFSKRKRYYQKTDFTIHNFGSPSQVAHKILSHLPKK